MNIGWDKVWEWAGTLAALWMEYGLMRHGLDCQTDNGPRGMGWDLGRGLRARDLGWDLGYRNMDIFFDMCQVVRLM